MNRNPFKKGDRVRYNAQWSKLLKLREPDRIGTVISEPRGHTVRVGWEGSGTETQVPFDQLEAATPAPAPTTPATEAKP
jgi:hypothetical protein